MKILKNAGDFEVLTKPQDVIKTIASAARTCYQSQDKSTPETDKRLVQNLMNRGHHAMFEFATMNVRFKNVCRGFTHEMVRHRLASFAQESTRYVDESNLSVVVPPHKNEFDPEDGIFSINDMLINFEKAYKNLREKGWKAEDARQVLPIATKSEIVVGANIREWRHIFKMRCDHFAHWEIRAVMLKLLNWCIENIPVVFEDYYFFTLGELGEKEYARPLPSITNIMDTLKHAEEVYGSELTDKIIEKHCNLSEQTK